MVTYVRHVFGPRQPCELRESDNNNSLAIRMHVHNVWYAFPYLCPFNTKSGYGWEAYSTGIIIRLLHKIPAYNVIIVSPLPHYHSTGVGTSGSISARLKHALNTIHL